MRLFNFIAPLIVFIVKKTGLSDIAVKFGLFGIVAVALLGFYSYRLYSVKQDGREECQHEAAIGEIKVVKEVVNVRSKAAIASIKRDMPDWMLRNYID